MPVDLQDRSASPEAENDPTSPGQQHYDDVFSQLTSAEHMAKDGAPDKHNGDSSAPTPNDTTTTTSNLAAAESNLVNSNLIGTRLQGAAPGLARAAQIKSVFWSSRRRKIGVAGGGVLGLIAGAAFMGGVYLAGPLQLIHLSQVLQHSFAKDNEDSSSRLGKLFRYSRASKNGDYAETRVGMLGSRVFGSTVSQLKDVGIEITRGPSGAPTRTTIDTDKLKSNFPELDGMNDQEKISFLSEKLDISADLIRGSGNSFVINQNDFDLKTSRALTKSTIGLLNDGKIASAVKSRVLTKFFNLPSLFHPLKRALASKENSILNARQATQEEKAAERQRETAITEPTEVQAEAAVTDVKDESSKYNSTVMKALLFTGGACFIRSVSGDIVLINRDRVAVPAALRAVDLIAVGAQVQSGQDLTAGQAGAVKDSLSDDNGHTIWQGQALEALANNNKANPGLVDLPVAYRQTFSTNTTASTIRGWANNALGGSLLASATCSKAGITAQILVGLTAGAISAIGEAASAGTLTPVIVAGWAAKEGVSFAVTATAMHFVEKFVLNKETEAELTKDAFSGPVGGDLLAYGSREASNMVGISSGGVELGNKATTLFAEQEQQKEQQQFASESFFARTFSVDDERSLLGRLSSYVSPSWNQNINSLIGGFLHMSNTLPAFASTITPHASAAAQPYDWGFSQYGIPENMIADPNLSDPYANAAESAHLLDGSCLNSDGTVNTSCNYIDRAHKCFGVNIEKNSGIWDVIPESSVNPSDDSYTSANCAATNQQDWRRIIMFVFDTNTMKAAACYQNDEQSCIDLGLGSVTDDSTNTATGPVDEGTNIQLAQKILDYRKSGRYSCDNPGDCVDLQKIVNGQSLAGSDGCKVQTLDTRVLQLMLYIIEVGHFKLGTYALCGDHGNDSLSGTSGHSGGKAVDISSVDSIPIAQDSSQAKTEALKMNQFLNGLPSSLALDQQISYGYGNHYDADLAATQQAQGSLCTTTCISFYGQSVESEHENHIHAGYK